MIAWRYLVTSGLISLIAVGCNNSTNSSVENAQQVLQEDNVSQLLTAEEVHQKAGSLVHQGNSLLDAKRYHDALLAYDQAIAMKANSVELWINRGNALTALQQYEQASQSYDRAIAIQPNQDEAWFDQGNALTALTRYQAAVKAYDQAIAIKPDKKEAWINRGIALTRLKQYKEGLASYNQALSINQNADQAYYNKACSYALQDNVELTIENLQRAIQLVPDKYRQLAGTDSDFAQVRSDLRFQRLLKGG
jgi:tetratricopeptide (TPR) repeat protein